MNFGFFKGSILINLEKYNYSPGEMIRGNLVLKLKKQLESKELNIRLFAKQKTSRGYVNQSSTTMKVFDITIPLSQGAVYSKGESQPIPFEIKIPSSFSNGSSSFSPGINQVINVTKMVTGFRSLIKWKLKARLKLKGFDITKTISVNIS